MTLMFASGWLVEHIMRSVLYNAVHFMIRPLFAHSSILQTMVIGAALIAVVGIVRRRVRLRF